MDVLWDILVYVGHAIEQMLVYVETHHWGSRIRRLVLVQAGN